MKLYYKIFIAFLGILIVTVIVFCTIWFSKSEPGNQKVRETPAAQSPKNTDAVHEGVPETQPTGLPAGSGTPFEQKRKKLFDNKNIIEVAAFKNMNDLLYVTEEQGAVNLYGVSISNQDTTSQSKLLEKVSVEDDMKGIWDISPGSTFSNFLYLSDAAKTNSIVLYDLNSLTKRDSIPVRDDALFVKPLLIGLDDRILYARLVPDRKTIAITSSAFDMKEDENILTIGLTDGAKEDVLGWMDISSDEKSMLFTLKDVLTGNYVLWTADLPSGAMNKLTNGDESILSAKWSKDGRKIVYSKKEGDQVSNIFVYDFDKNSHIRITSARNRSYSPDWSYYGDKIIYVTEEEKGFKSLYLIDYK